MDSESSEPSISNKAISEIDQPDAADSLSQAITGQFHTVLADPPWRLSNRHGKASPEHGRLFRYPTLTLQEIAAIPVANVVVEPAHLYLWVPNALLPWGLQVMDAWGFTYKTNLVWYNVRKDGGPDRRGVRFYYHRPIICDLVRCPHRVSMDLFADSPRSG